MFKGCNELVLNEATMIVAVQTWLTTMFLPYKAPTVTAVKAGTGPGVTQQFEIKFSEAGE